MINFFLLGIYSFMSVAGLVLLKHGASALKGRAHSQIDWPTLIFLSGGTMLYAAAFAIWIAILSRIDLSIAYPVAIGLTLSLLAVIGPFVLNEAMDATRAFGTVLIFVGIFFVTRSGT